MKPASPPPSPASQGTPPDRAPDSLGRRYLSKLGSRLTTAVLGLATVGLVPRALGPALYGDYNFLTFFFARVVKFLNFGTSTAFYTKLSARTQERGLLTFYGFYFLVLAAVTIAAVAGSFALGVHDLVWPNQRAWMVMAAAVLAIVTFASTLVHQTCDAYGLTVRNEQFVVTQSVLATAVLLTLFFTGVLTVATYFAMQYLVLGFTIVAGWWILARNGVRLLGPTLDGAEVRAYAREFFEYSHPLFVYSLVIMLVAVGDRWILQHLAGSRQQGFYSLGLKFDSIIFLFTSAMSALFTREMAVSYGQGDTTRMRRLFERFIPMFLFLTAYMAAFVSVNAHGLAELVGGDAFGGAAAAIAVLAFSPVYQTFGQLSGSVFLVTERTRLFRNINVGFAAAGMLLSLYLMVPEAVGGRGMGALGLAIKVVVVQLVIVNVQLWFNARYLRLSFAHYIRQQIVILALLYAAAWLTMISTGALATHPLARLFVSGLAYTGLAGAFVWIAPSLIGTERAELKSRLADLLRK